MSRCLFGTSGIRMKVDDMPREFVVNIAMALGTYSKDSEIVIGIDTRKTSPKLKDEFISGLSITGKRIIDLGIATTPTVAMASEEYGTGVVITASHNPPEYNGFKFWHNGRVYSPEEEKCVEEIFHKGRFNRINPVKNNIRREDYTKKHKKRILKKVGKVDNEVSVLIDCANGAGSVITPKLLDEMGCNVVSINTEVNGEFPHGLEPIEENLSEVCEMVKKLDVDIGIVHDGDADRSAAIDYKGKLIEWDSFLAVLAYGKNRVVTTVDASMRIEEVCKEVVRTSVGDVAVANAIERENADFGGEPSGSFIFPEVHLFPDGVLTAAVTAKLISQNRFYEILNKINNYPMKRIKIPCVEDKKLGIMERLKDICKNMKYDTEHSIDYTDGLKILFDDGWFLIRPSGTESFIRITAEAKNYKRLDELIDTGKEMIDTVMSEIE